MRTLGFFVLALLQAQGESADGALGGDIVGLSKVRGAPSLGEEEYDRLFLVTLPPAEGLASCVELRYGE